MRYAIFSDVHANLDALDAVVADAVGLGAEKFICLGDAVGYGPMPEETVSRLRQIGAAAVAGNHDDAVSGRMKADDFIDLAGDAVERHRLSLSSDNLAWLKSLSYTLEIEDFLAVHGEITEPERFFYTENEEDAKRNFAATSVPLIFVGHTHCPGIFLTGSSGAVYSLEPVDFSLEDGKRYIVNPGSVGYPRESGGVCRSSYVIYDTERKSVFFRFLPFSISSVLQRGLGGRRFGRLAFLSSLAAVAVAAGAAYFLSARKTDDADSSLVIKSMSAQVDGQMESFSANLKLSHKSLPVRFKYRFLGPSGEVLGGEEVEVKKSLTRSIKIAEGTKSVELKVLRRNPGENSVIESFLPAFKPK